MDAKHAVTAFSALGHENRAGIYRLLVQTGPRGLNAGTIAERMKIPPSSLTFHLQRLLRARLVTQTRKSRHLIYSADFDAMNALVQYLTENCCGLGKSCAPIFCPAENETSRKVRGVPKAKTSRLPK